MNTRKYLYGLELNNDNFTIEKCYGCDGKLQVWWSKEGNELASKCLNPKCGQELKY